MWKQTHLTGNAVDFSTVLPEDDWLHPVAADAPYDSVETYLCGFNIPHEDINSNIYLLWHPALKTMSMQVFVYRGARLLPHQLAADYYVEHQYLPMAPLADGGDREFDFMMGSCRVRMRIVTPLDEMRIEIDDHARDFKLDLRYRAALPPVGRPGGHHFTQLMKTSGALVLDGKTYPIDGYYMRDRSWGYRRPEQPERTPPYRWMTGWFGENSGFVVAWLDTSLLDAEEFGPHWHRIGGDASGKNKWESGGATPSLNLRSGWFTLDGQPRPVVRLDVRTLMHEGSALKVKAIELEIEDSSGAVHSVRGETASMLPKLYWQNLLVYMHSMRLECGGRCGNGDLMDTYSNHHIRRFGV